MFDNIGNKIKKLAEYSAACGVVLSVISAIVIWIDKRFFVGLLVLVFGCLLSWIGSFGLYGFGELIEKVTEIANSSNQNKGQAQFKNSAQINSSNRVFSSYGRPSINVKEGDQVSHSVLGRGTIANIDTKKGVVTVVFDQTGEKNFMYPDAFQNGFLEKE